jgi:hypothetical protein
MSSSRVHRKDAADCGAPDLVRANFKRSADHTGTVVHDVQAHALGVFANLGNS